MFFRAKKCLKSDGDGDRRNIFTVIVSIFWTTDSKMGIRTEQVEYTYYSKKQKRMMQECEREKNPKKHLLQCRGKQERRC